MTTATINWGERASSGGGGGGGDANVTTVAGALNEEVMVLDTEVVVGGFVFDPTLYPPASAMELRIYGTIVDPNGTGGAILSLRLYDRGAPGTPIPGTLIGAANLFSFPANVPATDTSVLTGLFPAALRMYELRAELQNPNADPDITGIIRWGGLEVT